MPNRVAPQSGGRRCAPGSRFPLFTTAQYGPADPTMTIRDLSSLLALVLGMLLVLAA
jgi:hypothetical protein